MTDLTAVHQGYEFPPQVLKLDHAIVSAYVAAVEDTYPGFGGPTALVPPLAVLALAMRGLYSLLLRHPGAVHLSQQVRVHKPIPVGSLVMSRLRVRNRSVRHGFAVLTLDAGIETDGVLSLSGSMLLMVPLAMGDAHHG